MPHLKSGYIAIVEGLVESNSVRWVLPMDRSIGKFHYEVNSGGKAYGLVSFRYRIRAVDNSVRNLQKYCGYIP